MVIFILFNLPTKMLADGGDLKMAVRSLSILLNGSAKVNDTASLRVRFNPGVNGTARIVYRYTDKFAPPNKTAGEVERADTVAITKDVSVTRYYDLKAFAEGYSLVEVSVIADSADAMLYLTQTHRSMNVEHFDSSYAVRYDTTGYCDSLLAYEGEEPQRAEKSKNTTHLDRRIRQYTLNVNISGNVHYTKRIDDTPQQIGVYGARLVLGLRNTTFPADPVLLLEDPIMRDSRGVLLNLAKADVNGNFTTNRYASFISSSGYDQLVVYVLKENNSARLKSKHQTSILLNGATSGLQVLAFPLDQAFIVNLPNQNIININASYSASIDVNIMEGRALRNMELSWDYTKSIYKDMDQIPVDIDPDLRTYTGNPNNPVIGNEGVYDSPLEGIKLDDEYTILSTVSHEYGHYVQDDLNNVSLTQAVSEGWAVFYQCAVNSYATKKYGEEFDFTSNCEEAPWISKPEIFAPRYANLPYKINGSVQWFACFLWNMYDGYNDGDYGAPLYNPNDNDDVNAKRGAVFTAMQNIGGDNPWDYRATFEAIFNDQVLNNSIRDIFNFLAFDNVKMRPAQLKNLQGTWTSTGIVLTWQQQHYVPKPQNYDNWEVGYRVNRWDENTNSWVNAYPNDYKLPQNVMFASPPPPTGIGGSCVTFMVTAYNSSGDSYIPQAITVCPPSNKEVAPPKLGSNETNKQQN